MAMYVKLLGMFFNKNSISSDDEPETSMTIKKDTLNRSTGQFIGRFVYGQLTGRTKIVWDVAIDGVKVNTFGSNLPFNTTEGKMEPPLFRWPGSAKANKIGTHTVEIKYGYIPNIVESKEGLVEWGKVQNVEIVKYTVTLTE